MRCPECTQIFEVLDTHTYDFTSTALGCLLNGNWPKYTSRVYLDNVELLRCDCGIAPNVPEFFGLQQKLFGSNPSLAVENMPIDPYSGLVYIGTWDDDAEAWNVSGYREH